jgi:hypothetical protein
MLCPVQARLVGWDSKDGAALRAQWSSAVESSARAVNPTVPRTLRHSDTVCLLLPCCVACLSLQRVAAHGRWLLAVFVFAPVTDACGSRVLRAARCQRPRVCQVCVCRCVSLSVSVAPTASAACVSAVRSAYGVLVRQLGHLRTRHDQADSKAGERRKRGGRRMRDSTLIHACSGDVLSDGVCAHLCAPGPQVFIAVASLRMPVHFCSLVWNRMH